MGTLLVLAGQYRLDRTDPSAVTGALADLFIRTECVQGLRESVSENELYDAYTGWAADRWVAAPSRPVVVDAVVRSCGGRRYVQGRVARVLGVSLHPKTVVGPRSLANEVTLDDLAERAYGQMPWQLVSRMAQVRAGGHLTGHR